MSEQQTTDYLLVKCGGAFPEPSGYVRGCATLAGAIEKAHTFHKCGTGHFALIPDDQIFRFRVDPAEIASRDGERISERWTTP